MTSKPAYPIRDSATTPAAPQGGETAGRSPDGEGAQPPLGNLAESVGSTGSADGPFGQGYERKKHREEVQKNLREITRDPRLAVCGLWSIRPLGSVDVRKGETGVSVCGLSSCGRWYNCPRCALKIASKRREEVLGAVLEAVSQRMTVAMVTLTLRHRAGDPLVPLLDGLAECWRKGVGTDKAVRRLRAELGFSGYVRTLEITHGRNGWHPHFHFLFFFDPEAAGPSGFVRGKVSAENPDGVPVASPAALDALGAATLRAWKARAKRLGLRAPTDRAYDLRVLADPSSEVADYLSKSVLGVADGATVAAAASASREMTSAATKAGRKPGSRTNWQLIEDAAAAVPELLETGVVDPDIELFLELEAGCARRPLTLFSPGLRARLKVGEEVADEDVVAAETEPEELTLLGLDRSGVGRLRHRWHDVRHRAQHGGRDWLAAWLDEEGVPWLEPDDPVLVADREAAQRPWERGEAAYDRAVLRAAVLRHVDDVAA